MIKSQQLSMKNQIRNKQMKVRKKLEILFLEMILNKINRKLIKKKNNQILKKQLRHLKKINSKFKSLKYR